MAESEAVVYREAIKKYGLAMFQYLLYEDFKFHIDVSLDKKFSTPDDVVSGFAFLIVLGIHKFRNDNLCCCPEKTVAIEKFKKKASSAKPETQ